MTPKTQHSHNAMTVVATLSTSSDQMTYPFLSEGAPMYLYQDYSPDSVVRTHVSCDSDATYSQLPSQYQPAWPTNLDQGYSYPSMTSTCYPTMSVTIPWSRGHDTSPPKYEGQDEDNSTSQQKSLFDQTIDRRRERRKAQNRLAQRNFRARKESLLKESSGRLELLERELQKARSVNGALLATVSKLRKEVGDLTQEISGMKSPNSSAFDMNFD